MNGELQSVVALAILLITGAAIFWITMMGISEGCEIGFEQWENFCVSTNMGFGDGTPSPSPTLPRSGA